MLDILHILLWGYPIRDSLTTTYSDEFSSTNEHNFSDQHANPYNSRAGGDRNDHAIRLG